MHERPDGTREHINRYSCPVRYCTRFGSTNETTRSAQRTPTKYVCRNYMGFLCATQFFFRNRVDCELASLFRVNYIRLRTHAGVSDQGLFKKGVLQLIVSPMMLTAANM